MRETNQPDNLPSNYMQHFKNPGLTGDYIGLWKSLQYKENKARFIFLNNTISMQKQLQLVYQLESQHQKQYFGNKKMLLQSQEKRFFILSDESAILTEHLVNVIFNQVIDFPIKFSSNNIINQDGITEIHIIFIKIRDEGEECVTNIR